MRKLVSIFCDISFQELTAVGVSGTIGLPMSQPIDAIYEEGVFKPRQPVHLNEHQPVRLTVEPVAQDARQVLIERLKALGHLQGQPLRSPDPAARPLTHEELQRTLPQLDPPLSKQILEDRR